MKKLYVFILTFICLMSFSNAFANTVVAKGYIKYTNGTPVANQYVKIRIDSLISDTTCAKIVHIRYTDASGFFIDTLTCPNVNIQNVIINTINYCTSNILTAYVAVNSNNVAETTILINNCNTACSANFTTIQNNPFVINFSNGIAASANYTTTWSFGDGTSLTQSNSMGTVKTYAAAGTYTVCLKIQTTAGCSDSICKAVVVYGNTSCNAVYQYSFDSLNRKVVKFFAATNTGNPTQDPVVERKWRFGDGDSLLGNIANPTHTYAQFGTYTVCLRVKTQSGCVSESCQSITVANPNQFTCTPSFTYTPQANIVSFTSAASTAGAGDSIVSRKWVWGDSTTALTGNIINPQHVYAQPGLYNVCLTIKTVSGCEKTICQLVTATNNTTTCVPQFTFLKLAPKKIYFNSLMSWAPLADSIISRKWTFGDGTTLTGNNAIPTHEYNNQGIYTVCLKIKTISGCENEICKPVLVQDSVVVNVGDPIRIVNTYPNPATTNLNTVVYSLNNNVQAELAIYDVYGVKKWSINKTLYQGNNYTAIPTSFLISGPYYFRVKTVYGIKSKSFFKL